MSGNGGGKKKPAMATATESLFPGISPSDSAAVDDLLRAAEDDLLLNLRVDAHSTGRPSSSSSSAASLDPDLARRFEALRSAPPPPTSASTAAVATPAAKVAADGDDEWGRILGDDLAARFAALKGTSPAAAAAAALNPVADGEGHGQRSKGPVEEEGEDDDEVDEDGVSKEVEKLMQWAKDAARLDPSTKSDEEEEEEDDDDDDEEEKEMETRKKKLQQLKEKQQKSKPRKWFF